jgi:superfamily I DNA and/or RNA helicase
VTDATITAAAVFCGLKVMVVGGSNESVEEAMEKLLSMKTAARPIRFRSSFLQPLSSDDESDSKIKDASAENDIQSVDDAITMAEIAEKLITQHNLKHAEYSFNVQRYLFIDQQIKAHRADDHSFVSKAAWEFDQAYNDWLTASKKPTDKRELARLAKHLKTMQSKVDKDFLTHAIDVVYVTCNSSISPVLTKNFEFDIIICEEGGQTSVAGFTAPLAFHRERRKVVVVSGDDRQTGPQVASKERNECIKAGQVSFMERLATDSYRRYEIINLTEQRRMHPDIAALNSPIFYSDGAGVTYIQNGAFIPTDSAMDDKVQRILNALMGESVGYKGSRVIAINVEGKSDKFPRTQSAYNDKEAQAVISFVCSLAQEIEAMNHHETSAEKKKMFTIGMMTTYTSQERKLNKERVYKKLHEVSSFVVEKA